MDSSTDLNDGTKLLSMEDNGSNAIVLPGKKMNKKNKKKQESEKLRINKEPKFSKSQKRKLKELQSIVDSVHVTSDKRKGIQIRPSLWNGNQQPCYLFARKFLPESLEWGDSFGVYSLVDARVAFDPLHRCFSCSFFCCCKARHYR